MLKKTSGKGFTIIEVVITIAIGAAVMALVLNAVSGARRSQRNNARTADINQVAAAVNQYIAGRNQLPTDWEDIQNIVDDSFGHYIFAPTNAGMNESIPAQGWAPTLPVAHGGFLEVYTGSTAPTNGVSSTATLNPQPTTQAACTGAGGTWTAGTPGTCGSATGPAQPTGNFGLDVPAAYDQFHVFRKTSCIDSQTVGAGGIREMALVYRLEGQTELNCLEV